MFGEAEGVKLGNVAQPLRATLTGKVVSPPVFDVMTAIGREEALERIRDEGAVEHQEVADRNELTPPERT